MGDTSFPRGIYFYTFGTCYSIGVLILMVSQFYFILGFFPKSLLKHHYVSFIFP